jgi:hypothetical protein
VDGWRRGVRWFAAEFLVVVAGILTALALQGWWAERQDRGAELQVLRQMRTELTRDAADVRTSIARSREVRANVGRLATHLERRLPYSDTLDASFARLGEAVPLRAIRTGPYATLESRGLTLVTNDSLRAGISNFYEVGVARAENLSRWLTDAEVRWMPALLRRFRYDETTSAATPRSYAALLRDEDFVVLLDDYSYYISHSIPVKERMAREIDALRAEIERELVRRGGA